MSDERDEYLADLYRLSSRDEPPARLDRVVMAQARQSLRRRTLSPFGNHRLAAAALAGVCAISVLLVVLMPEQSGKPDRTQSVRDADAPVAESRAERGLPETISGEAAFREESVVTDTDTPAANKPKFDFYSVLPSVEPETPVEERSLSSAPAAAPPAVMRQAGRVEEPDYLQLDGYRNLAEAGKMKDKLEFMRLQVHVQQVVTDAGQPYYRLSVGPYSELDELERVQGLLHKRGIETTLERKQ